MLVFTGFANSQNSAKPLMVKQLQYGISCRSN